MELIIYVAALILLYYCIQLALLTYGVFRAKVFNCTQTKPEIGFTLVVPFKNEENNLPYLLHSLQELKYDKLNFEVIFINDGSTDHSVQKITDWRISNPFIQTTILNNVVVSNSSKKDAISRAVLIAKNDWIITTDADCALPPNFFNCYSSYIANKPECNFIIGAVKMKVSNSFLYQYQAIDFASLQAVTLGSFYIDEAFMCNGANLCFTKQIFKTVNGYEGVNHIASGDDVFLLQKVKAYQPTGIGYLLNNEAVVSTLPVLSWLAIIKQRARWGKKSTAYKSTYPKILGAVTLLANFAVLFLLFGLFFSNFFIICLFLLAAKFISELVLLLFYKNRVGWVNLYYFPISFLLYPFITFLVCFNMIFFKSNWK